MIMNQLKETDYKQTQLKSLMLDIASKITSNQITDEEILQRLSFYLLATMPPQYNTTLHAPRMVSG